MSSSKLRARMLSGLACYLIKRPIPVTSLTEQKFLSEYDKSTFNSFALCCAQGQLEQPSVIVSIALKGLQSGLLLTSLVINAS